MAQAQDSANTTMVQQVNGHIANNDQQDNQAHQPGFAVTATALALWDYAKAIMQDDHERAQTDPLGGRPYHPPVPMTRRDRCILTLMVEGKRDELKRKWEELNELELLLGLEHV
ncbi:hypothetical protein P692DRAFT_20756541 [Suillus brevipes Sb2]|nr:hypothetical protein P692DRAFT_20756541 [Suillus brevipes Sb2]